MADLGPLPGDPDIVLRDATQYLRAAEAIAQAAEQLRQLSGDRFRSQAVDAIVGSAADAAGTITQAHHRYSEAAQALLDYATPMREAHDRASALTATNRDLVDRANTLRYQVEDADRQAQTPGPEQVLAIAHAQQLHQEWDALTQQMHQAESEWNAARDLMHQAARAAASRIHNGNEFGDLNDSFWDDLGDLFDIVKLVANIVSVVLKIVSLVLTVLAVVFAVLAVFFPLLAVISAALFLYAQVVNIAIAILALLQFAMNGFHLLDLVLAGVAVLAAFGGAALGSALGSAARAAASGATQVLGGAASSAIGEIAKQAVTSAVESVTDTVVDGILDLGSAEARSLYDSLDPIAGDFLDTAFGSGVEGFKDTMTGLGEKVGADFNEGVQASGLADLVDGIGSLGRPAAAALGSVYDTAYDVANSIADTASQVRDSVSNALSQASSDALAPLLGQGLDNVSSHLSHDLGQVLGGPEIGDTIGGAVEKQLSNVIGGLPGGDAVAHAIGDEFGGLAQRTYDSSTNPKLLATTGGASRG